MGLNNLRPREGSPRAPSSPHLRCVAPEPCSGPLSLPHASCDSGAAPEAARWGPQRPRRWDPGSEPLSVPRARLTPWESLLSRVAFPAGRAAAPAPRITVTPPSPCRVNLTQVWGGCSGSSPCVASGVPPLLASLEPSCWPPGPGVLGVLVTPPEQGTWDEESEGQGGLHNHPGPWRRPLPWGLVVPSLLRAVLQA